MVKLPHNPNPRGSSKPASHDANTTLDKNGETAQGPLSTPELREHLEGLLAISTIASKLFNLLGDQLTSASHTIPIQRGCDIVKDLGDRARAHKDGLKTAFDPLREYIAQVKAGFWEKHGASLEAAARARIQQKIRERVPDELNRQLERYVGHLETKETERKKLEAVIEISDARLRNSLLRTKYPAEPVSWVGDLPELKFSELISADSQSIFGLAKFLGLSPAPDDDKMEVLNSIMSKLGVAYRGLPAWTGMLLVPTRANL